MEPKYKELYEKYGLKMYTIYINGKEKGTENDCRVLIYYENGNISYKFPKGNSYKGIPKFSIVSADNDQHTIATYNEPRIHIGSVTVGNVTTGGVYTTGGDYSTKKVKYKTGKVRLFCYVEDTIFEPNEIEISDPVREILGIPRGCSTVKVGNRALDIGGIGRIKILHEKEYNALMAYGGMLVSRDKSLIGTASQAMTEADIALLLTEVEANAVIDFINDVLSKIVQYHTEKYWDEHKEEKAILEKRKTSLAQKSNELNEKVESIPNYRKIKELEDIINAYNDEIRSLSKINFIKKMSIEAKIKESVDILQKEKMDFEANNRELLNEQSATNEELTTVENTLTNPLSTR